MFYSAFTIYDDLILEVQQGKPPAATVINLFRVKWSYTKILLSWKLDSGSQKLSE